MRKIPLRNRQGKILEYAIVDNEDYENLIRYKWHVKYIRKNYPYAVRTVNYTPGETKRTKTVFMHQQVMGFPKGKLIDHEKHKTLDNRKKFLRICSRPENRRNSVQQKNNKSGYKGVSWHKTKKKWIVLVNRKYVGSFHNKKKAARVYNEAAKKEYGKFAYLNIIKK